MPALQSGRHIGKDFTVKFTLFVSLKPDFALNPFQGCRFSVLIHEPVQVRQGRPVRRIIAAEYVILVFSLEVRDISILKIVRGMFPGEREENVVDKRDWSCRAFNIEQYAAGRHDINERPRQTGSTT